MKQSILFFIVALTAISLGNPTELEKRMPGGCIQVPGEEGRTLPLLHTDVQAKINGVLAQTVIKQQFRNDTSNTLDLTYIFPMPHRAAVGAYQFTIGDRIITGTIQTREKAREIYNQAREQGKTAALLEQQRPNIFTQSLTNIPAGALIEVEITYDEVILTEDGQMEWVFPMVVGPRFMPENADASQGQPTLQNPEYQVPEKRSGNTISLHVQIENNGLLGAVGSTTHSISVNRNRATTSVDLDKEKEIPNKDFILRFSYLNNTPDLSFSNHFEGKNSDSNTFLLTLLPPNPKHLAGQILPREFFFIIDVSGSMYGQPLDQAIATAKACMNSLRPDDTFQIMTFAGSTAFFKPKPVHPTKNNLSEAMAFLNSRQGGGGTYMMQAIKKALGAPKDPERYRMAVMFTDGYIGNEKEIIAGIRKLKDSSRLFAFGIGSSVNRYLLESMGRAGNGFTEIVSIQTDLNQISQKWENRLRSPVLTDLTVEFSGAEVSDMLPSYLPDLFAGEPVLISGHYKGSGDLKVTLRGRQGRKDFKVTGSYALKNKQNETIPRIWAREKIRDLNFSLTLPNVSNEVKHIENQIQNLGLTYRLMTAYTSFVAVDNSSNVSTDGRVHSNVQVPLPEGVSPKYIGMGQTRVRATKMVGSPRPKKGSSGMFFESVREESEADSAPATLLDEEIVLEKKDKAKVKRLLYKTGQSDPIGLILTLDDMTQISKLKLKNNLSGKTLTLKESDLKKVSNGSYHLLFKNIPALTPGTWTLYLPDGKTFQFTL